MHFGFSLINLAVQKGSGMVQRSRKNNASQNFGINVNLFLNDQ